MFSLVSNVPFIVVQKRMLFSNDFSSLKKFTKCSTSVIIWWCKHYDDDVLFTFIPAAFSAFGNTISLCCRALLARYCFASEKESVCKKSVKSAASLKITAATVTSLPQPRPLRRTSNRPVSSSRINNRNCEVIFDATIFASISLWMSTIALNPWIALSSAFLSASDRRGTVGVRARSCDVYVN